MKAFRVEVNGVPCRTAGIGPCGVLHVILGWVRRQGEPADGEFELDIAGLDIPRQEHVRWAAPAIGLGDEITVRVVETDDIDPPLERYGLNEAPG